MARNYIVVIDKTPVRNDFPRDYFPRGYHYIAEAQDMCAEVEGRGGKAHVIPKSQFTPELLEQLEH